MAALFFVAWMSGCSFDPGGLSPGGGTPDASEPPADSRAPVDSRPAIDSGAAIDDSGPAMDAPLPPGEDAAGGSQRRKQITIDSSRVEAPATPGFLPDFPVLFSVVDPDLAARASADGRDIYFVGADGLSRLEHEIEKWVPATGALVAWVKLPVLSDSTDTVFYIQYGDPDLAPPVNPANVWTNGFVAVWHLAQDPGPGMPGDIVDSTTGNDGAAHTSMQPSDLVTGQIGDAIDFDGSDDEITFVNPISGSGSHTISAWVNQRATSSDDAVVVLGTGAQNQARWFYSARRPDDEVAFGFYANDQITSLNIENDGWTLLHWTFDGTASRVYVNGALVDGPITAGAGVNTQGTAGRIGNVTSTAFGTAMNLDGLADEARIATTARPAEWMRTEFNNQSSPSSFYTVGPEIE